MSAEVVPRMHSRLAPPEITVLPADEAYDYEFVASRLHDQHLLRDSIALRIFRAPLLVVPVGGCRRGGCFDAGTLSIALAVRNALTGRPGFTGLRLRKVSSLTARGHWLVEWGDKPSEWPLGSSERVRFYGFSTSSHPAPVSRTPAVTFCGINLSFHLFGLHPRDEPAGRSCR
ncbi:DUF6302 family protein [Streptomyces scopuliridis]|uniref:DUF6302 family protein n=1 Tax=Streptomyces scopuliridis TaxID=452529 RepID=UPI0036787354